MTYRWEVFGTAVPEPATGELRVSPGPLYSLSIKLDYVR